MDGRQNPARRRSFGVNIAMSDPQHDNIGFALLRSAQEYADQTAIRSENAEISYGQFATLTANFAQHLLKNGVKQRDTVAVRTRDLVVYLASIFACALVGARWIATPSDDTLIQKADIDHFLETDPEMVAQNGKVLLVDQTWAAPLPNNEKRAFPGYADKEDIFMIGKSSGTTGIPKLVATSFRACFAKFTERSLSLRLNRKRITGLFKIGAGTMNTHYISALLCGGEICSSPDLDSILQNKVDLVFGSPSQVQKIIGNTRLPIKLPLLKFGGAAVPDQVIVDLLDSFEKVLVNYGSSEAGSMCGAMYSLDGAELKSVPIPSSTTVEIVDEATGEICKPGMEGAVRAKGGSLASFYIGDAEATQRAFHDGWFYSGDLGQISAQGILKITGRIDERINIAGTKVLANLLDQIMISSHGVKDAICFMVPRAEGSERLTAFVVLEPGCAQDEVFTDIRLNLMRSMGQSVVPERFFVVDEIPKTETGKPNRRACVALVLEAREKRQTNT